MLDSMMEEQDADDEGEEDGGDDEGPDDIQHAVPTKKARAPSPRIAVEDRYAELITGVKDLKVDKEIK